MVIANLREERASQEEEGILINSGAIKSEFSLNQRNNYHKFRRTCYLIMLTSVFVLSIFFIDAVNFIALPQLVRKL